MNPQSIYDFGARHMLTQNQRCIDDTFCTCQLGTLRCAMAVFAIENDVTSYGLYNTRIPSLRVYYNYESLNLLIALVCIHDGNDPSLWPNKLEDLAIEHQLQPFSISDLPGGRGRENPLAIWYTDPAKRKKLLAAHKNAGTSYLLEDYLKAWPLNTSGVC